MLRKFNKKLTKNLPKLNTNLTPRAMKVIGIPGARERADVLNLC